MFFAITLESVRGGIFFAWKFKFFYDSSFIQQQQEQLNKCQIEDTMRKWFRFFLWQAFFVLLDLYRVA